MTDSIFHEPAPLSNQQAYLNPENILARAVGTPSLQEMLMGAYQQPVIAAPQHTPTNFGTGVNSFLEKLPGTIGDNVVGVLQNALPQVFGSNLPSGGLPSNATAVNAGAGDPGLWGKMFGYTGDNGIKYGGAFLPTANALLGLGNVYLGYKGLGLAEDTFKENKRQFSANFNNQAKILNDAIYNKAHVRKLASPLAEDPDKFAQRNRVNYA